MIIFIIPAYNESENIPTLLAKISGKMGDLGYSYRVILVNDGSLDDTVKVFESAKGAMPAEIISYYPNKGVGVAFKVGFKKAIEISGGPDIIITKEADNTSDLGILDSLIRKIDQGYDLVLASCYAKDGAVLGANILRLMLSRIANFFIGLFMPLKNIHTFSSFYRAYSNKSLREMNSIYQGRLISEDGFECMVELLMKFSRHRQFKITEVPLILDAKNRIGKSKMKVIKTSIGFLKVIFREGVVCRMKSIL